MKITIYGWSTRHIPHSHLMDKATRTPDVLPTMDHLAL